MPRIVLYATMFCPFCHRAKSLLKQKGASFEEIDVTTDRKRRAEMAEAARGDNKVPQIWIGEEHVGGCDQLFALERAGKLDEKLQGTAA